jgi:hypothetical protein
MVMSIGVHVDYVGEGKVLHPMCAEDAVEGQLWNQMHQMLYAKGSPLDHYTTVALLSSETQILMTHTSTLLLTSH